MQKNVSVIGLLFILACIPNDSIGNLSNEVSQDQLQEQDTVQIKDANHRV